MNKNIIIGILMAICIFLYLEVKSFKQEMVRIEWEIHRYVDPVRNQAVQNRFDIEYLQRNYK